MTMERTLGMSEADVNDTGARGTDQGTQMKTDYGWHNGGNGTNSSGFSGLPGGYYTDYSWYIQASTVGYWWSSSADGTENMKWCRKLYYQGEKVVREVMDRNNGFFCSLRPGRRVSGLSSSVGTLVGTRKRRSPAVAVTTGLSI